jgi:arsenate reductase
MKEIGYDLTRNKTDSVFEFFKEGRLYDYVIYVCDKETEAKCPVFPGIRRTLSWPFPDPGKLDGTRDERLSKTRKIRDEIKSRIENWMEAGSLA